MVGNVKGKGHSDIEELRLLLSKNDYRRPEQIAQEIICLLDISARKGYYCLDIFRKTSCLCGLCAARLSLFYNYTREH